MSLIPNLDRRAPLLLRNAKANAASILLHFFGGVSGEAGEQENNKNTNNLYSLTNNA
ncbi:MAG: hypothetical protein WBA93_25475 [Microcoleaceae cyanobacterium]